MGVGPNGAGLPKALLFLLSLAHRWPAAKTTRPLAVIQEVVGLRRLGYRFIALADDNFYPVTLTDIDLTRRQKNHARVAELEAIRSERFALMEGLAQLPGDMIFFTQITMEAAEDPGFLDAMRRARIKGALVGVEAVTPEGLKSVFKDFNSTGEQLRDRLRTFRQHGVHVLGSFIFGWTSDREATFDTTAALAEEAELTFAQFVTMTPFPGTVDFEKWEKSLGDHVERVEGVPITRYWLIPGERRPKLYIPHPTMSADEIRERTQRVWDKFYSLSAVRQRSKCAHKLRDRLAFLFVSRLYRQMYANTGIATDSARRKTANRWARWLARPCWHLFRTRSMPGLAMPDTTTARLVSIDNVQRPDFNYTQLGDVTGREPRPGIVCGKRTSFGDARIPLVRKTDPVKDAGWGQGDRSKVNDYLDTVREVDRRIQKAEVDTAERPLHGEGVNSELTLTRSPRLAPCKNRTF